MTEDKAAAAREGLLKTVTGRAKEVAGALTGNDELVEEGQLTQAEAAKRKAADAESAVAAVDHREADAELAEATGAADERRTAAQARASERTTEIDREQRQDQARAEHDAVQQEAHDRADAERDGERLAEARLEQAQDMADDAEQTEADADADTARLLDDADRADEQAAQLRAQADK